MHQTFKKCEYLNGPLNFIPIQDHSQTVLKAGHLIDTALMASWKDWEDQFYPIGSYDLFENNNRQQVRKINKRLGYPENDCMPEPVREGYKAPDNLNVLIPPDSGLVLSGKDTAISVDSERFTYLLDDNNAYIYVAYVELDPKLDVVLFFCTSLSYRAMVYAHEETKKLYRYSPELRGNKNSRIGSMMAFCDLYVQAEL